jgi:hypothetical protein
MCPEHEKIYKIKVITRFATDRAKFFPIGCSQTRALGRSVGAEGSKENRQWREA